MPRYYVPQMTALSVVTLIVRVDNLYEYTTTNPRGERVRGRKGGGVTPAFRPAYASRFARLASVAHFFFSWLPHLDTQLCCADSCLGLWVSI